MNGFMIQRLLSFFLVNWSVFGFGTPTSFSSSLEERLQSLEIATFGISPPSESIHIGAFGELLYWTTDSTHFHYALIHGEANVPYTLDTNERLVGVNLPYEWGFRAGARAQFPPGQWSLDLIWTQFQEKGCCHTLREPTLDLHTLWDPTGSVIADEAFATLKQSFQTLDFILGKPLPWSSFFELNYSLGLRAAWIEEIGDILYGGTLLNFPESPIQSTVCLRNYFRGLGLMNGLSASWNLPKGLQVYGGGEIALLWGELLLKKEQWIMSSSLVPSRFLLTAANSFRPLKTNIVCRAGIQWETPLFHEAGLFSLFAGYELNFWPSQVLWARLISIEQGLGGGAAIILPETGDLAFQGLTVGIGLLF